MRRSSIDDRSSFAAPLRVRNDGGSSIPLPSTQSNKKYPSLSRSSVNSSRPSINSRPSTNPSSRMSCAPTPCKSFASTVASSNRNSQGSISYGRNSMSRTNVKKDPRCLSERSVQHECIKKLVDFLIARNCPFQINNKMLISPMNKDFVNIFEFLYKHIDPQFILPQKFEEEVIRALKIVGYPYMFQKSALSTVGSRHSWPVILGCLDWLREFIEAEEIVAENIEEIMFPPENFESETVPEAKMLFQFFQQGNYLNFLKTGEEDEDEENDYLLEIAKKTISKDFPYDIDDIENELHRLEEEQVMLDSQEDPLSLLKQQEISLRRDIQNYDKYLNTMNGRLSMKKSDVEKLKSEVNALRSSVLSQEKRIEAKECIFRNQVISQQDIDRMRIEKESLQKDITKISKDVEQTETTTNNNQMEIAEMLSELESNCNTFNEIYRKNALVPSSDPTGYDLELSLPDNFELKTTYNQHQYNDWVNRIKPCLTRNMKFICDNIELLRDEVVEQEAIKLKLGDAESELQEEIIETNKKLVNVEEEITKQKDSFSAEYHRLQDEEANLEARARCISGGGNGDLELMDLEKKIEDAHYTLNLINEKLGRQTSDSDLFLRKCYTSVQKHFKELENVKKVFDASCVKLLDTLHKKSVDRITEEQMSKEFNIDIAAISANISLA